MSNVLKETINGVTYSVMSYWDDEWQCFEGMKQEGSGKPEEQWTFRHPILPFQLTRSPQEWLNLFKDKRLGAPVLSVSLLSLNHAILKVVPIHLNRYSATEIVKAGEGFEALLKKNKVLEVVSFEIIEQGHNLLGEAGLYWGYAYRSETTVASQYSIDDIELAVESIRPLNFPDMLLPVLDWEVVRAYASCHMGALISNIMSDQEDEWDEFKPEREFVLKLAMGKPLVAILFEDNYAVY